MTKILEKPTPPAEGSCCGGGCSPCIWDFYYEDRQAWKAQQAELVKVKNETAQRDNTVT